MIIGIDTGKNIGIAFIDGSKKIDTIKFTIDKEESISDFVNRVIDNDNFYPRVSNKDTIIFIEGYSIYGAIRSIISATSGKLDIVIRTGILLEERLKIRCHKCIVVPPNWKGTMDDKKVKERIYTVVSRNGFKINYPYVKSSHEWDAVGLALNGLGLFNYDKPKKNRTGKK